MNNKTKSFLLAVFVFLLFAAFIFVMCVNPLLGVSIVVVLLGAVFFGLIWGWIFSALEYRDEDDGWM